MEFNLFHVSFLEVDYEFICSSVFFCSTLLSFISVGCLFVASAPLTAVSEERSRLYLTKNNQEQRYYGCS